MSSGPHPSARLIGIHLLLHLTLPEHTRPAPALPAGHQRSARLRPSPATPSRGLRGGLLKVYATPIKRTPKMPILQTAGAIKPSLPLRRHPLLLARRRPRSAREAARSGSERTAVQLNTYKPPSLTQSWLARLSAGLPSPPGPPCSLGRSQGGQRWPKERLSALL